MKVWEVLSFLGKFQLKTAQTYWHFFFCQIDVEISKATLKCSTKQCANDYSQHNGVKLSLRYHSNCLYLWNFKRYFLTLSQSYIYQVLQTIQMKLILFYAAGLLPVVCQFGREFFRFAWLLSDKNLNALKTSRYKTFPSRLAMAWRLNLFTSLLIRKKFSLPEPGIEPGTSWSRVSCSTNWATYPFVIWEWKLVVYILQCRFWIKMG